MVRISYLEGPFVAAGHDLPVLVHLYQQMGSETGFKLCFGTIHTRFIPRGKGTYTSQPSAERRWNFHLLQFLVPLLFGASESRLMNSSQAQFYLQLFWLECSMRHFMAILALFECDFEFLDLNCHQFWAVSQDHSFSSQFALQLGHIHEDACQARGWSCLCLELVLLRLALKSQV